MNNSTDNAAPADSLQTMGTFFAYDPQLPIDGLPQSRVVTCCYKQTAAMKKKGIEARDNVYVRVPTGEITTATIVEKAEELAPTILALIQQEQDQIIRAYHKAGGVHLYAESISLAKVVESWESKGASSLDGETITQWFTETVTPALVTHLSAKLGDAANTGEAQAKIAAVCKGYCESFVSLASGKTQMPEAQRTKLSKCMEVTATIETVVGAKLMARLERMAEREREALEALTIDLDI